MAEKNYILGVDVGNTVIKAVLFDTEGHQIAHCAIDGQSSFPEPGHVERDLSELWENGCAAIREVTKLRGEVELVLPGSLPNDGKVIEDARKYD